MKKNDESCDMSTFILFINVDWSSIDKIIFLFCIKQLIQTMIHFDMRLLRRLWISFFLDTWSYASITSRLSSVAILFLLIFQTMWICFVSNSNVVLHALFRRLLICVSKRSLWISAKLLMRLTMIDSSVLFNVLRKAINLCALKFV